MRLPASITLVAAGDQFHQELFRFCQILRSMNHIRMVITDQPLTQFALGLLPIIGIELGTSLQPPLRNAVKANQLAAVEQRGRIRASVKDTARTVRLDPEQPEAAFQTLQTALKAMQPLI